MQIGLKIMQNRIKVYSNDEDAKGYLALRTFCKDRKPVSIPITPASSSLLRLSLSKWKRVFCVYAGQEVVIDG
jgi:hypothetical protein